MISDIKRKQATDNLRECLRALGVARDLRAATSILDQQTYAAECFVKACLVLIEPDPQAAALPPDPEPAKEEGSE